MSRRSLPEINAGSMADIAFLLLIFFLVTTTMDVDTGLVRKLPAMPEEEEILDDSQIKARNIYVVLVNSKDQLLVEEELMDISQLREGAISFLDNWGANPNLSDTDSDQLSDYAEINSHFTDPNDSDSDDDDNDSSESSSDEELVVDCDSCYKIIKANGYECAHCGIDLCSECFTAIHERGTKDIAGIHDLRHHDLSHRGVAVRRRALAATSPARRWRAAICAT